jgi:hypothetical protein
LIKQHLENLILVITLNKTLMNHIQNSQKIHTSLWILKISRKKSANQKSLELLPNMYDLKKENHTLGYGFKNI